MKSDALQWMLEHADTLPSSIVYNSLQILYTILDAVFFPLYVIPIMGLDVG